jgi:hypothetical protein
MPEQNDPAKEPNGPWENYRPPARFKVDPDGLSEAEVFSLSVTRVTARGVRRGASAVMRNLYFR